MLLERFSFILYVYEHINILAIFLNAQQNVPGLLFYFPLDEFYSRVSSGVVIFTEGNPFNFIICPGLNAFK